MRGGLFVCGTTSDAGKSFVVAGLCRLLARRGVAVAPFKAQNMALNAAVTADGAEIGHAQWVQARAAGAEPEAAMNPILLKPTSDRTSQVVVMGQPMGDMSASGYHETKRTLLPVVRQALADLRSRYDVVICEGAGSPAEINLLDRDLVNLPLAREAGLPAILVGDIDRGGVFAALYGTVALLPDDLRPLVRGFVVNRLRGDPALLGDACGELERRCGVPTLGVLPYLDASDFDAEDSLALDHAEVGTGTPEPSPRGGATGLTLGGGLELLTRPADDVLELLGHPPSDVLDVVAIRWPRVSNAGDLDPLRLEPNVRVRWVQSPADLGRPDLVVLPGSKNTRGDLAWFGVSGLADAVEWADTTVVGICAGLQMVGGRIDDPAGVEGPAGTEHGLGWLPLSTAFEDGKVLDRPTGTAVSGPGAGRTVAGYRIHHGRVHAAGEVEPWLVADDGAPLGWQAGWICGTTLHGLFEPDEFRASLLGWVARRAGKRWTAGSVGFAEARAARLDRIADALESHLDLDRLFALIEEGAA
jgi:adenosylcobyric acid synthase